MAELYGLRDGLTLIQNRSLLPAQIEMDSSSAIYAITSTNSSYPIHVYSLIENYKQMLAALGNPPINHTYREVNGTAD